MGIPVTGKMFLLLKQPLWVLLYLNMFRMNFDNLLHIIFHWTICVRSENTTSHGGLKCKVVFHKG